MIKNKVLWAAAIGLILGVLLVSCTLSGISDSEFAQALMEEAADATGLYTPPSKGPDLSGGLTFTPVGVVQDPPGVFTHTLTAEFDNYVPKFEPDSSVSGTITVTIEINDPIIQVDFLGDLTVSGEHAGQYHFEATLEIDLAAEQYEYSGTVRIDGTDYYFGS